MVKWDTFDQISDPKSYGGVDHVNGGVESPCQPSLSYIRVYRSVQENSWYIRPQTGENRASRPLCHPQAPDRQISSWVGDHQRIPAVVCFCIFGSCFLVKRWIGNVF
jgi:hypothetical protein